MRARSSAGREATYFSHSQRANSTKRSPSSRGAAWALVNTRAAALGPSVEAVLKERRIAHRLIDADGIARDEEMFQSANMALLGAFASFGIGPFRREVLEATIRARVPEKFLAKNLAVFGKGYKAAESKT